MPRGNRRGPDGEGPMTGRGLGYCAGSDAPGYMSPGPGMGARRRGPGYYPGYGARGSMSRWQMRGGRGFGWFGQRFAPPPVPPTAEEEMSYLQGDLDYLKRELKATEDRIAEVRKEPED